jgi:hypothetical protein
MIIVYSLASLCCTTTVNMFRQWNSCIVCDTLLSNVTPHQLLLWSSWVSYKSLLNFRVHVPNLQCIYNCSYIMSNVFLAETAERVSLTPSLEDGHRSSFRKVMFSRIPDDGESPKHPLTHRDSPCVCSVKSWRPLIPFTLCKARNTLMLTLVVST